MRHQCLLCSRFHQFPIHQALRFGLIPCLSFLRRELRDTLRDFSLGGACLALARRLRLGVLSTSSLQRRGGVSC